MSTGEKRPPFLAQDNGHEVERLREGIRQIARDLFPTGTTDAAFYRMETAAHRLIEAIEDARPRPRISDAIDGAIDGAVSKEYNAWWVAMASAEEAAGQLADAMWTTGVSKLVAEIAPKEFFAWRDAKTYWDRISEAQRGFADLLGKKEEDDSDGD
jgi:hypothetical protein